MNHTHFSLDDLKHGLTGDGQLHPARDWFVLLGIAAVLVGLSVGWNALIFMRVEAGETLGDPVAQAPKADTGSLESVKALFAERANERERYRTTYRFVDPAR